MTEENLKFEQVKAKGRMEKLREKGGHYEKEIRHEEMKDKMRDIREKITEEEREVIRCQKEAKFAEYDRRKQKLRIRNYRKIRSNEQKKAQSQIEKEGMKLFQKE